MVHKPEWFRDGEVFVSYAPTVGINKDGEDLFIVDAESGIRSTVIDNRVQEDVVALFAGEVTSTSRWINVEKNSGRPLGVPVYFDDRSIDAFYEFMDDEDMGSFTARSLGSLIDDGILVARQGHGSPSADLRTGSVPYIKVSDLRAGQVNINPTNRVNDAVAQKHWRGKSSGLSPYDLLTPIRTSKNIGDFSVLMPGQEQLVLTKEILVLHAAEQAYFDNFYLLWAMSLKAVRRQWDRIVFMQTNREDVGLRYREVMIPFPPDFDTAYRTSGAVREYYEGMQKLRSQYMEYLERDGRHHIFMSTVEYIEDENDYQLDL